MKCRVAIVAFLILSMFGAEGASGQEREAFQVVTLPYLQSPMPGSVTVMWVMNAPCVGWVEYGEGTSLDRKAVSSHHGLVDANEPFCRVPLTELKPGTTYSYRTVSMAILDFQPYEVKYGETVMSEIYQFQTPGPDADSVTFVVFNDMHEAPAMRDRLFPIAKTEAFDLAFLNGDILSDLRRTEQVVMQLAKPYADLCGGRVPFVLVRGNHETRGGYARQLMDHIATPGNRYYFSFDWGPVHFLVLDSGEDKPDINKEYSGLVDFDRYRDEETMWLKEEVESSAFKRAPFRVAFSHMPLFGDSYGEAECTKRWSTLLNDGKIDLCISGHTHTRAVVEPRVGAHDYPIFIGGSPKPGEGTLMRVAATRDQLDVTVTGDNGETLVTRRIMRRTE